VKCGYGRQEWSDGCVFEGYWLNGQPLGLGVFKTPEGEAFEGIWVIDKASNMRVFRQKEVSGMNCRSIEAWSDGSYYLGNF